MKVHCETRHLSYCEPCLGPFARKTAACCFRRSTRALAPHWLSQQRQRPPQGHEVKPFPENHKRFMVGDKTFRVKISSTRWCARCRAVAMRDGFMGWYHDDGREKDRWVRKMPDGNNLPQSDYACSVCKRRFCWNCFRMEDDEGNPHPDAWDHDNKCLLARPCDDVVTG